MSRQSLALAGIPLLALLFLAITVLRQSAKGPLDGLAAGGSADRGSNGEQRERIAAPGGQSMRSPKRAIEPAAAKMIGELPSGGWQCEVSVYAEDGAILQGAWVRVQAATPATEFSVSTDPVRSDRFELSSFAAPKRLVLVAGADGYAPRAMQVKAEKEVRICLFRKAFLRGRVTVRAADGEADWPQNGEVQWRLRSDASNSHAAAAGTDAAGWFELQNLPAGRPIVLSANASNALGRELQLNLDPGWNEDVNVLLEPGDELDVVLVDHETGDPVLGTMIGFGAYSGGDHESEGSTHSFRVASGSDEIVHFSAEGYVTTSVHPSELHSTSGPVSVPVVACWNVQLAFECEELESIELTDVRVRRQPPDWLWAEDEETPLESRLRSEWRLDTLRLHSATQAHFEVVDDASLVTGLCPDGLGYRLLVRGVENGEPQAWEFDLPGNQIAGQTQSRCLEIQD